MSSQPTVLVVDDAPENLAVLGELLRPHYRVRVANSGSRALQVAHSAPTPDIILLDIMMPDMDGHEFLRVIRSRADTSLTPFIFLTAKSQRRDFRAGMDLGADDYLVKPFAARELLARIKAVLRRTRMLPPNLQVTEAGRLLAFGAWQLDTTARHLIDEAGTVVPLSGAEYRLLRVLLDHPQRVLSRDQLLNLTQGREAELFDRSIDLLVSRLRQRLGDDAREPKYIKTVRNGGYVFASTVEIREERA